jgi:ribonuclease HII
VLFLAPPPRALVKLIDDSKKLTAARREAAFAALCEAATAGLLHYAVAAASTAEIARINILRASQLAMARALARLPVAPTLALVDGNQPPALPCAVRCIVGGDAACLSIAAASILAKVTRDRAMARLDLRWPGYGFASHMGYATEAHRAALARLGPTPHHRRGFATVDQAVLCLG